ncbi:MAG: aminotransferase class V-fold PLP-dependent enzyme [Eubacteriales bacterium]|nr:aminotransferase class V-fold PLP-dependent enzyme [Eubacteriales bacterium]
MQSFYFDNASTSYPKAPGVGEAMKRYVDDIGMNVGRGGYRDAIQAEQACLALREKLCKWYHSECVEGCILTPGATFGLNMVLKGYLQPGDHVLVSAMEHNAVMRPLRQMDGIVVETVPCAADGTMMVADFEEKLNPQIKLVCITAVSNVCGTIMPFAKLGRICHSHNIPFVVDASQAVGHLPIDCLAMEIDALVFSAHKGLLGPQGIGAALLRRSFAERLRPFVTGGTGSISDQETQPLFLPDKFEAGTPNLPGVYGFSASIDFVIAHQQEIDRREQKLCERFLSGIAQNKKLRLYGLPTIEGRVGVFALDFPSMDNGDLAEKLEREYGILTRSGLQCAPAAHQTMSTFPQGVIRFSLGWQTTEQEIDFVLAALRSLVE